MYNIYLYIYIYDYICIYTLISGIVSILNYNTRLYFSKLPVGNSNMVCVDCVEPHKWPSLKEQQYIGHPNQASHPLFGQGVSFRVCETTQITTINHNHRDFYRGFFPTLALLNFTIRWFSSMIQGAGSSSRVGMVPSSRLWLRPVAPLRLRFHPKKWGGQVWGSQKERFQETNKNQKWAQLAANMFNWFKLKKDGKGACTTAHDIWAPNVRPIFSTWFNFRLVSSAFHGYSHPEKSWFSEAQTSPSLDRELHKSPRPGFPNTWAKQLRKHGLIIPKFPASRTPKNWMVQVEQSEKMNKYESYVIQTWLSPKLGWFKFK